MDCAENIEYEQVQEGSPTSFLCRETLREYEERFEKPQGENSM